VANFYGELVIRITSDTAGLKKGLAESAAGVQALGDKAAKTGRTTAARMEHVGRQMQNVGRQMTQFITLPVVAGFALAGIAAFKFQDSLMKIQNLTGTNAAQTKAWGEELLKLGAATGQTPLKLAESLYFVASSGFKGAEAMAIINVSAKAAAAGLGDVKVTADVLTSAMNAYGKKTYTAAQVTDFLMKTIEVGKAEPVALATSLGRIMPVAANLKVGLDELGGNVAALTLGGLSSAEAVTALRGTMMSLVAPAKMSIDQLKTMGISYQDLTDSIAHKGLLPTLKMLWEGTDHNMLSMRKIIPNVRALNGVLSLLGANYEDNLKVIDKVADAHGALDRAMKNTAQQPIQKLRQAWASLQGSFIKVGAILLPYFAQLAGSIARVAESFTRISPGWRDFILRAAATAAVIGPLVMVMGTLINAIGLVRGAMAGLSIVKAFSAAFSALGSGGAIASVTAFTAALSPLVITLGALAAAAGVIYGMTKLTDWLDGTTKRIGAMRTAAEAMAADESVKAWAEKNFGGSLLAKGKNDFVFTPTATVDAPTNLLANWVRTTAAEAAVAQRESQATLRAQSAKGMVAFYQQEIHEAEASRRVMERQKGGWTPAALAARLGPIDAYIASLKGKLAGVTGIWRGAQDKLKTMKLKDQAIVFTARMGDLKDAIAKTKARIKDLAGKPHTIKVLLAEQRAKERLADLQAGLKNVAGKSYQIRLQARIESLQSKVDTAKRALEDIPKGEHSAKVTADITKLSRFIKDGQAKVDSLKQKLVPPVTVNPRPSLTACAEIQAAIDGITGRSVSIMINQVPGTIVPPPKLAAGGIFTRPQLSLIGEAGPEVLIPLTRPARARQLMQESGLAEAGGGSTTYTYNVNVLVPGGTTLIGTAREVGEILAPHVGRALARAEDRGGRRR
jgi:TP901 family phage tail tape measure protein